MADLDDFFAKKDRKKSKGVKKFTTTEDLAKKLEETHKREKEKLKEKKTLSSQNVDGDGELGGERQEEDEWKDFEEEKKDYTNLKIQNLQIVDSPSGEDGGDGEGDDGEPEMEENDAGEMVPRKKQPSGPWKKVSHEEEQERVEERRPEPVVVAAAAAAAVPSAATPAEGAGSGGSVVRGTYLPPHQRNPTPHTPHQPGPGSRLRSKVAPDINNEAFFPTLSASKTVEPASAWGRRRHEEGRGFEEVRNSKSHSTRIDSKMTPSGQGPKLQLGNKWDALTQDQS